MLYELHEGYENEFRGMYFHPKLINTILVRIDVKYSCEVDMIMDKINQTGNFEQIVKDL